MYAAEFFLTIFPHLNLGFLMQFPAKNDKKYIYEKKYVFKILLSDQLRIYHKTF